MQVVLDSLVFSYLGYDTVTGKARVGGGMLGTCYGEWGARAAPGAGDCACGHSRSFTPHPHRARAHTRVAYKQATTARSNARHAEL